MLCIARPMPSYGVGLSVRPSVMFVYSVEMNKYIFKIFPPPDSHTIIVFPYQTLWQYCAGNVPDGGVECSWGRQKSRLSTISGYRSMTAAMRTTTATVQRAVYRTDSDASMNLCLSQPAWTITKRRKQNLYVRSCKSEAEVTSTRRLRSTYCRPTAEANYWQIRSIARPLCDSRAILVPNLDTPMLSDLLKVDRVCRGHSGARCFFIDAVGA